MNKKLVVIYSGDDWSREAPDTGSVLTTAALAEWCEFGLKNKINVYRAEINWYDVSKNGFTRGWTNIDGRWQKISQLIIPDLVFDKTAGSQGGALLELKLKIAQQCQVLNHPFFRSTLGNKAAQYLFLREFIPRSYLVSNSKELKGACSQIRSRKIVVKPLFGSGGSGIVIDTPIEIFKTEIKYPVLVQEFKENTKGVPGFSKKSGLADLRLIFSNRRLIYALSRRAKPTSLFTNIHRGAKAQKISLDLVPLSTLAIADDISRRLLLFPYSFYTLDFIFDDQEKPWLMELNTSPGLDIVYLTGTKTERADFFRETIVKNIFQDN